MKRLKFYKNLTTSLLGAAIAVLSLTGCSMMETDLSDCYTGLYVNFKYDYNTARADMFPDHVGGLTLYVFDENNRFVMQRDVENTSASQPLKDKNYTLHLTEQELAPGKYHLLALGMQKGWESALATPGAKYRRTVLNPGDPITKLKVTLDRGTTGADGTYPVEHQNMPLDTLWATRMVEIDTVEVVRGGYTRDTLSLIRDTKQLKIQIAQTEQSEEIDDTQFDVRITDRNGGLLYNNELDPEDNTSLLYTPYAQWTNELPTSSQEKVFAKSSEENVLKKTAHYELFFNRLVMGNGATLVITSKQDNKELVRVDLATLLQNGRYYWERQNYSAQEYLDREYQYDVDFYIVGGKIKEAVINVLSWTKRIQFVEL